MCRLFNYLTGRHRNKTENRIGLASCAHVDRSITSCQQRQKKKLPSLSLKELVLEHLVLDDVRLDIDGRLQEGRICHFEVAIGCEAGLDVKAVLEEWGKFGLKSITAETVTAAQVETVDWMPSAIKFQNRHGPKKSGSRKLHVNLLHAKLLTVILQS